MSIFKRRGTWGEALLGKKEHKIQMRRVKLWEKEIKKEKKKNRGKQ